MSFYENNRAGNAVLSAFPGKILQKTAIKKEPPGPLVRGIPGGSCCYVVAAGASLVNLILDALVGLIALDGCLREGLVIPPVHDARADGKAGGDELLELCVVDGDDGLARCAQNLVTQRRAARCAPRPAAGRFPVPSRPQAVSFLPPLHPAGNGTPGSRPGSRRSRA